jgi:hypothetical protein
MKLSTVILSLSLCVLPPIACIADTITAPMVPAALVTQNAELPNGANDGGETFGSFSVAQPATTQAAAMSAATSAYAGYDPSVAASASFLGSPGPYNTGALDADSELVYYVKVAGPSGGPVPVQLLASGQATTTDSRVHTYASLDVVGLLQQSGNIFSVAACGAGGFTFCNATPNAQQFQVNTVLQFTPNELYEVVIEAQIESGSFYGPLATGAFSASALVDPTFQLTPSVSDQYQILTSPNLLPTSPLLAETPEPSNLILTASGIPMVLVGVWRRVRVRSRMQIAP